MEKPVWREDPAIANISKEKLDFLQSLVVESKGLSQREMLPFLMSTLKKAKEQHVVFEQGELNLLIQTIKKYSTEEEINTIEKMLSAKKKG